MGAVLINGMAVVLGALCGLLLRRGMSDDVNRTVMNGLGMVVLCVGLSDAMKTHNMSALLASVTLGGGIGAALRLHDRIERAGERLLSKYASGRDAGPAKAFVTSAIVVTVGAMAIYGSIKAGLGDPSILYLKSGLDFVGCVVFAAAMGWGVVLAAVPMTLYQAVFALAARPLLPIVTPEFLNLLSGIGGVIVAIIGINQLELRNIRTANFLPALLGAFVALFITL